MKKLICCGNCRYFDGPDNITDENQGVCRRYAPRPVCYESDDKSHYPITEWPIVSTDLDWCGEWSMKLRK